MMIIDADRAEAIERIRSALDEDKLPRKVRELLDDLDAEGLQSEADEMRVDHSEEIERLQSEMSEAEERAGYVEGAATAASEALDCVEDWEAAEGREDKAEAREGLIGALQRVVEAFDDIPEEDALEVGTIDADGYDVLSPEEIEANAKTERLAHGFVARLLEDHLEALRDVLPPEVWHQVQFLSVQHAGLAEPPEE